MGLLSSGSTHIGMKRKTNQDSISMYHKRNFFMVADGMGGHNGGDIASQMTVKHSSQFLEDNIESDSPEKVLKELITHVNNEIYAFAQDNAELKGMGTTVSSILFKDSQAYIGNVGDSRVYLYNEDKLYQMTKDHSLVQEKLNLGIYNREAAKKDPQKNVLIRTVGFEPDVEIDVFQYRVTKNDLFLICSDGLHGKVSDQDIAYLLDKHIGPEASQDNLDQAVKELIDQANANGGQDNISVILIYAV